MSELDDLRALRAAGDEDGYLAAAVELVRANPNDVAVRVEAAYACDRFGTEHDAIAHYDAAWRLGVPDGERKKFLVGYGSTLRNVGRADEAVALLSEAIAAHPDYAALKAFLALALHSAGHVDAAIATALDVAIDVGREALHPYDRALTFYRDELLARAMSV